MSQPWRKQIWRRYPGKKWSQPVGTKSGWQPPSEVASHPLVSTILRYRLLMCLLHGYNHRVIILNRLLIEGAWLAREREESDANFPEQNVQRRSRQRSHWLMALVVSYLAFVYGRSLWAERNGGENSLHWKTNMLPQFSIMTLWTQPYLIIKIQKHCIAQIF